LARQTLAINGEWEKRIVGQAKIPFTENVPAR